MAGRSGIEMTLNTLTVSVQGPIGEIRFCQPKQGNPLSPQTLIEIAEAAEMLDQDQTVRSVVISGEGPSFCHGFDLTVWPDLPQPDQTRELAQLGNRMIEALKRMRPVTVAALSGWVVGGGVAISLAADLGLADPDTIMMVPETKLGIPFGWYGLHLLISELGPGMARDLILTGRQIEAQEGWAKGIVSRIASAGQVREEALRLAGEIATKPPLAIQATKRGVNALTWQGADPRTEDLVAAFYDPEAQTAAREYRERLGIATP